MAVIFDLDQTLCDSQVVSEYRRRKEWYKITPHIGEIVPYDGINEIIAELNGFRIPIVIVTSSPSHYCRNIISYNRWKIDHQVCYHDTTHRKPHPEPFLKALSLLKMEANKVIAVGDAANDTYAARRAGIFSVGALWGSLDTEQLLSSQPDLLCQKVEELHQFIRIRF